MAVMKDLEYYLAQARRIAAHREEGAEKEIRKLYKSMLKDLQTFVSEAYTKHAENDKLTFAMLQKAGYDARFLEEIEAHISVATPKAAKELRQLVSDTYKIAYDGMVDAVTKGGNLDETFAEAVSITPRQIKKVVKNPIMEVALEKNHKDIIYDIKQVIAVGLMNGDRYTTMARRIADQVDGSYKKAIRIARTEAHRVREAGNIDAATDVDSELQAGTTGMRMVKVWKTMKDERVRPQRRRKGKGGWSTKMGKGANHMKLDGQIALADEDFDLLDGNNAPAPGQSGVAGHDINCRCYASYEMMTDAEYHQKTGKHFPGHVEKPSIEEPDYLTLERFNEISAEHNRSMTETTLRTVLEDAGLNFDDYVRINEGHASLRYGADFYVGISDEAFDKFTPEIQKFAKKYGNEYELDIDSLIDYCNDKGRKGFGALYDGVDGPYSLHYVQSADGSHDINTWLRGGVPKKKLSSSREQQVRQAVADMDDLIASRTLPEDMMLDRWAGQEFIRDVLGIDIDSMQLPAPAYGGLKRIGHAYVSDLDVKAVSDVVNKKFLGSVITDKAFMSASAVPENNVFIGSTVRLKIITPKGTHAFVTTNEPESEIILGRNTKLEIIGSRIGTGKATDDFMGVEYDTTYLELITRVVE